MKGCKRSILIAVVAVLLLWTATSLAADSMNVICTPGINSWTITVVAELDKIDLDQKLIGVSLRHSGTQIVDLNYVYVVSPQENSAIQNSNVTSIRRQVTWKIYFNQTAPNQAGKPEGRALSTYKYSEPPGDIEKRHGQITLSSIEVKQYIPKNGPSNFEYTVALWRNPGPSWVEIQRYPARPGFWCNHCP